MFSIASFLRVVKSRNCVVELKQVPSFDVVHDFFEINDNI